MENPQVGSRSSARAANANSKKRKAVSINNQESEVSTSSIDRLRGTSRRRVIITAENSASPPPEANSVEGKVATEEDRCSSLSLDHDASASCCSSNGSSCEGTKFADLEDEIPEVETSMYYSCRERRETTPLSEVQEELSDVMDSTARPSEGRSSYRRSTSKKMPTVSELEDFFAVAEKKLQKQFADRYNYDIVKDEPLEGRYEWARLKP